MSGDEEQSGQAAADEGGSRIQVGLSQTFEEGQQESGRAREVGQQELQDPEMVAVHRQRERLQQ